MSLITKRLMGLQPGAIIEIIRSDADHSSFVGKVNENDYTESLEIIGNSETLILSYDQIKSVKILDSLPDQSRPASTPAATAVPTTPSNPVSAPTVPAGIVSPTAYMMKPTINNSFSVLPFVCDIEMVKPTNKELETLFKSLPSADKKIANRTFQSYMSKLKGNELKTCIGTTDRFADDLDDAAERFAISDKSWLLAGLMATRCGNKNDAEFYGMAKKYDLQAISLYKQGNIEKSTAYACAAITVNDFTSDYKNKVYTIAAQGSLALNDMSGLCYTIKSSPDILVDANMYALIKYIYSLHSEVLPRSISATKVIDFIKARYEKQEISTVLASMNLPVSKSTKEKSDDASEVAHYGQTSSGKISILSWSTATGTIISDDGNFKFKYEDISDKALKLAVERLYQRDLKAINKEFKVSFEILGDRAVKITPYKAPKPAVVPTISESRKTQSSPTEYSAESYVNLGRLAIANSYDDNRFSKAYKYYEKAIELSNGEMGVSEFTNCSLTLYNSTQDISYLEKAYNVYKNFYKPVVGLSGNSTILDLLLKMDKKEEALPFVDRILADPKLSLEARLNYILHRANILFSLAEKTKDENPEAFAENLESAKTTYRDWEQRFLERPEIRIKSNYKKIYYNTVLMCMAKCFIEGQEYEEAEKTLRTIINFDSSNEIAKYLLDEVIEKTQADTDTETTETAVTDETTKNNDWLIEEEIEEESVAQVYEYTDITGWDGLNIHEDDATEYLFSLKAHSRIPCGLTYLKALSLLNDNFTDLYTMYSYAADNPMENLDYSLANVVTVFENFNVPYSLKFKKFAKAAAILRASFYHVKDNDFFVASSQIDSDIIAELPSLADAFEFIEQFRTKTGKGIDLYADYRTAGAENNKALSETIQNAASEMHTRYFGRVFNENINQKRFKLTKNLLFAKGRLVDQILTCVKENNEADCRNLSHIILENFMRAGTVISTANIDANKLDEFIDSFWDEAGRDPSIHERKSSQLMGSLRNNLKIPVRNAVEIYCQYYDLINTRQEVLQYDNINLYNTIREDLLASLESLKYDCETAEYTDPEEVLGCYVIRAVSREFIKKIRGEWSENYRKYFFADFLRTDHILLDESFFPELSSTFCDLPSFNVLSRIRAHVDSPHKTFVEHAEEIYSKEPTKHDFGTATKIAAYLEFIGDDGWKLPENHSEYDEQAKKQLREFYDVFTLDMCSAVIMGRIQMSDKFMEGIDDVAQYWYQFCLDTSNYGFFLRFVESCKEKIHEDAKEYENVLKKQLDILKESEGIDQEIYETIAKHIEDQLFTVAEEMMYRTSKGDFYSTEELPEKITDYITQFWSEFEHNFRIVSNSGTNLRRLVSASMAAKDRKGGQLLVDSWPSDSRYTSTEQIKNLLVLLGWSESITVKKAPLDEAETAFLVNESANIYNKRQYAHSIAAFGTQAYEDGFYAICVFGYINAERLIDFCRRLDTYKGNKILFLDYALTSSDRRKLAKLIKQQSFLNTYMFVDRVSLIYMANHYRGSGGDDNNRTLLATSIPFTYYQPYTLGSSSSIAPEMFIGRRDELLSIESPTGANLLYGGRQLGKSAILKKAKVEVDNRESGRIASFIDIKDHDYAKAAKKISRELFMDGVLTEDEITEDWEDLAFNIKRNILNKKISYLLLMLDEADCFIESCQDVNFQPIGCLKDIQQTMNGRFKFVLAGLHNVIKFKRSVALGQNSVITHLSSINVKPFNYKDACQLLTEPLGYLGFDFGSDETAFMQILSATNYFPGLIQLYCHKMVESMKVNYAGYSETNTPGYLVTANHINKVLADRHLLDEIKDKFEITLRLGEGNHYYIIALLLALRFAYDESAEGYNVDDIISMADSIGFNLIDIVSKEHLSALLEELCDLNILKKIGEFYTFRTKNFRNLLGPKEKLLEDILAIIDPENKG
ncbi:MAG: hypothetical protein IKB88_05040 [Clostridia bacterium]|nr:hypothetical protein [Clostridia bacterium]